MKKSNTVKIFFLTILFTLLIYPQGNHPNLFLNTKEVNEIKLSLGKYPLFDQAFNKAKETVDKAISLAMDVPIPKDAGGYTHERHKKNYTEMQLAGVLFSVTGEKKYAEFIKNMLFKYAELYPTLGHHPMASGESAGRLFWQSLNETVWLVNTAQAYDCIYDWLKPEERKTIEDNLFIPMAKFLSEEKIDEFDRIHNHGTWTVTAVGMIGYVMGNRDLVDKALYGSKKDRTGGFLKQIDMLFSPDGFYTEGPYYVRYAILPFVTFAKVINNNQPELKIFNYRNEILKKAFYSAIQLTNSNGAFIPINDALKEKTYLSPEVITALDFTYSEYGEDKNLLGIAKKQNKVTLSGDGLKVAKALNTLNDIPCFPYESIEYTDGFDGKEGGIGILRAGTLDDQETLIMKYTGHGLSHGHYDKLTMLIYDKGNEILQDYGAARFINVETKFGGRYLPETKSFTRQTIAHNTITVDGKSHYLGKEKTSEQYHADKHFFSASDPMLQVMSSKVNGVYNGVDMQRTMAMVTDKTLSRPLVIDVFKVSSKEKHNYDLPFWYMGHLTYSNIKPKTFDKQMSVLGNENGYQHIWNEGEGMCDSTFSFSWLQGNRYYSVTSAVDKNTKVNFVRVGGSDPDFNLRHEPGVILRTNADSHVFASVIEPHGLWDGVNEFSQNALGNISKVTVLLSNDDYTVVEITGNKIHWYFLVNNKEASDKKKHSLTVAGKDFRWDGNYSLIKEN